jgi:hypothetical protein
MELGGVLQTADERVLQNVFRHLSGLHTLLEKAEELPMATY